MRLSDILDQLEVGELSQLALTERENGELKEKNKKDLITHINMGLNALHKRFVLKRETVTIALQPNQLVYILDTKYAESNEKSTEPVKYILDMGDPFSGRVMQIEELSDDLGRPVPLNNNSKLDSARTRDYRTLVLPVRPRPVSRVDYILDTTETLNVTFRANHRPLAHLDLVYPADMVEIDLPDTHIEPLVYFIASRVMNPIGLSESFHAGNNYAAKYEAACMQVTNEGYEISEPGQGNSFTQNGWV